MKFLPKVNAKLLGQKLSIVGDFFQIKLYLWGLFTEILFRVSVTPDTSMWPFNKKAHCSSKARRSSRQSHGKVIPLELADLFICPSRLELLLDRPPVDEEEQLKHAWNTEDRSSNILVNEHDRLTFHRLPIAQSTDSVRGKTGFSEGIHLWEVQWSSRQRGTHAVVGVATNEAPLNKYGYQCLVGSTNQSWGWDLGRCRLLHNNNREETYPAFLSPDEEFRVPDLFKMALNMFEGTLSFIVEDQYLGVAFRGLEDKTLFPIVSAVWGHCEVTLRYCGGSTGE